MDFRIFNHFVLLLSLWKSAFLNPSQASDDVVIKNPIPCEEGWILFGKYCYKAQKDLLTWNRASVQCARLGGHLASIHSQEEQDFLTVYTLLEEKMSFWIGLYNKGRQRPHIWEDGSDVNYTNWSPGEPSQSYGKREECVEMRYKPPKGDTGQWNDVECSIEKTYICQKEKNEAWHSEDPLKCSSAKGGGWKFRGTCYNFVPDKKTWEDAERYCQDQFRGHLVTISDSRVDFFLNYKLQNFKDPFWIGIKLQNQLQQKWISGWPVAYNRLPSDISSLHGDGFCIVRLRSHLWIEKPCNRNYQFICESLKDNPPKLKKSFKGGKCPEPSNDWKDLDGEFCYYFDTSSSVTWYKAHELCLGKGGHLVSIRSQEESEVLQPFVEDTQERLFIGINSLLSNGDIYSWSDGTRLNFTNWYPGEPNSHREKCGELWTDRDMMWNDVPCDVRKGFICSARKVPADETSNELECNIPESFNENSPATQVGSQDATSTKKFSVVIVCVVVILSVLLTALLIYHFRPWLQQKSNYISQVVFKSSVPDEERRNTWSAEAILKEENYDTFE